MEANRAFPNFAESLDHSPCFNWRIGVSENADSSSRPISITCEILETSISYSKSCKWSDDCLQFGLKLS